MMHQNNGMTKFHSNIYQLCVNLPTYIIKSNTLPLIDMQYLINTLTHKNTITFSDGSQTYASSIVYLISTCKTFHKVKVHPLTATSKITLLNGTSVPLNKLIYTHQCSMLILYMGKIFKEFGIQIEKNYSFFRQ